MPLRFWSIQTIKDGRKSQIRTIYRSRDRKVLMIRIWLILNSSNGPKRNLEEIERGPKSQNREV